MALAEFTAGAVLAIITLRDVFDTAVVPGRSRGALRIPRRLVFLALPIWKRLRRSGITNSFGPVVLMGAFLVWMLLLVLSFGAMVDAFADSFTPALTSFGDALYTAGVAMMTIGADARPGGAARVVIVAAGFCGLSVMTLAVTYLLEVQSNIAHRDTGVLKITTSSGQPPSALGLLQRYAALGCRDELRGVLQDGRQWCAAVLQSHASHPSLIYFRSARVGAGWPAALGALLDLALIVERLLDEPTARGAAVLLREQAAGLAHDLCDMLHLEPVGADVSMDDLLQLCARLREAGYPLRDDVDLVALLATRNACAAGAQALAAHLGTSAAPFVV